MEHLKRFEAYVNRLPRESALERKASQNMGELLCILGEHFKSYSTLNLSAEVLVNVLIRNGKEPSEYMDLTFEKIEMFFSLLLVQIDLNLSERQTQTKGQ